MTWTRLDDGYDSHGKLLALGDGAKGDARRWVWTRILLYTNRHGSSEIPAGIHEAIPRATRQFVDDCLRIGLADEVEDGTIIVHDWPLYSDCTIEEKVAFVLSKDPEASANEVCRQVSGKRQIVLHEVAKQRPEPGSQEPPDRFPPPVPQNHQSGSRARARPVPSRKDQEHSQPLTYYGDDPDEQTHYNHALEQIIEACGSTIDARQKLATDVLQHRPPEARLIEIHWAITRNGTNDRLGKARSMIRRTSSGLASDQ